MIHIFYTRILYYISNKVKKCPIDELNILISLQLKNIPIPIFDLKLILIPLNRFNKKIFKILIGIRVIKNKKYFLI